MTDGLLCPLELFIQFSRYLSGMQIILHSIFEYDLAVAPLQKLSISFYRLASYIQGRNFHKDFEEANF